MGTKTKNNEQVGAKALSQVGADITSPPAVKKVRIPADVASLTILHIDDDPDFIELTRSSLPASKFNVLGAGSVSEAIEILRKHPAISLILCDIATKGQNGFALLEYLKSNTNLQKIPVLICSAMDQAEIVQKAASEGVAGYLVKPCSSALLLEKIENILACQVTSIMIVSGDRIVSKILNQSFERKFCQTFLVASKAEALQTLSEHRVHAIISELVLTDGTGPELLALIREKYAQLPIFFLDDRSIKMSEAKVISLGANGIIRLPLYGNEIHLRVTAAITR